jgi:hypothetical protein
VRNDWDDDRLLGALSQALKARQAVPPWFIETGKNAFAWHNIDAELAQLTYDSIAAEPAGHTRAESASIRALTFTSARITIELEVTQDALVGQVVPAQAATIEVQAHEQTDTQIASDEIGCFAVQPIPHGPFRLRCRAAGGIDVLTGWITL